MTDDEITVDEETRSKWDRPAFTAWFSDPAARELAVVGGKGANLARLVDAEFRVPDGFCVTTAAYRALVDDAELRDAIASLDALDPAEVGRVSEVSAGIRDRIRRRAFPDDVRRSVEDALASTEGDSFAVRSSATAEDLPTASFAGQHETFLAVARDEVLDRIRDCMASLFTDRAVTYRLRNGVSNEDVSLAVVVQELVDADVAGVLFTADPLTENRHVASVDANYGLGESIVAGDVSADNARIDRRTGKILSYTVGDKAVSVRPTERSGGLRLTDASNESPDHRTSGVERVTVPDDERTARALTDDQLRRLAKVGDRIESLFGEPQDIEWALVDSEFVLLQARPITSLYPLPSPRPADELLHVYLSFGHQQAMPEALPPLVVDFWRSFLGGGAARFQSSARTTTVATEAGGRIYLDLTPLVRTPLRRLVHRALVQLNEPAAAGFDELFSERRGDIRPRGRLESVVIVVNAFRRAGPRVYSVFPRAMLRFVRTFVIGPPKLDDEWAWSQSWGCELSKQIRAPRARSNRVARSNQVGRSDRLRSAFESVDIVDLLVEALPHMTSLLAAVLAARLLRRLVPDADDEIDAVGKGFEAEVVTSLNQRLGDLADLARDRPAVADALESGASLTEVEHVEGGGEFVDAFDLFLDDFGHRATGEIDFRRPRWREDPEPLLRIVAGNVARETPGEHRTHLRTLQQRAENAADRLEERADRGPFGSLRKRIVRRLIRVYRGGMPIRELPKHGFAHAFTAIHDVVSEAGGSLVADGQIDRLDDVWFLRRDELLAAVDRQRGESAGEGESAGGGESIADEDGSIDVDFQARRRAYERYAAMAAPPLLTSEGERPTGSRDVPTTDGTLVGTPVSTGIAEGVARVIRDPSGASLEPGEILIAPSTDPGWTPLFLNAAGLVMEVGGRLTHGALVAREYGIPAVASVADATTEIRTGDRVRVDGKRGTVELVDTVDE